MDGLDGAPTGLVSFSGTAAGRLDTISTTIDAAGDRLNWPNVGPLSVSARTVLTGSGAEIESLRVTAAGGELAGRARVPFDDRAIGSATLNWQSRGFRRSSLRSSTPNLSRASRPLRKDRPR